MGSIIPFPRARAEATSHHALQEAIAAEMRHDGLRGNWRRWVWRAEQAEALASPASARPSYLIRAAVLRQEAANIAAVAAEQDRLGRGTLRLHKEIFRLQREALGLDPNKEAQLFEQALADGEAAGRCR